MSERTGTPSRLVEAPPCEGGSGGIGFVDETHGLHEEGERPLLDPLLARRAALVELEAALPQARDREERLLGREAADPGVLDLALAEADAGLAGLGLDDELARLAREVEELHELREAERREVARE